MTTVEDILGIVDVSEVKDVSESDKWLIPGVVSTQNTLLFGTADIGKSLAVCGLLASLIDGREFLGITPLRSGLRPLIICADRGAELEYKERLSHLGIEENIKLMPGAGVMEQTTWDLLHYYAATNNIGVVVIDHATGTIDGDEKERLPWVQFWKERVEPFNLPVIVVAHSSDWVGQNGVSHRVQGNSASKQFARAQVEVCRTDLKQWDSPKRMLRSSGRYGGHTEKRFTIVDPGVICHDAVAEESAAQKRSGETLDGNRHIAELAAASKAVTVKAVAEDIAERAGLSVSTLERQKLPRLVRMGLLEKTSGVGSGLYRLANSM